MPIYQDLETFINEYLDPNPSKFWNQGKVINGNAVAASYDSAYDFYTAWRQNPAALTDEMEMSFFLPKGSYQLIINAHKTGLSGIQRIIFQNPDSGSPLNIGENDLYASTIQRHQLFYQSFSSDKPGRKDFRFLMLGKNPSSSGYFAQISRVSVVRL